MTDKFRNTRIGILILTFTLISIGVVMIYSSSAIYAYEKYGDNLFYLKRHLLWVAAGLITAIFFMKIDIGIIKRHSRKLMLLAFFLLIIVLLPKVGAVKGGARRWINLGFINFQPIEIIKPFYIIYLADFLDRKSARGNSLLKVYLPCLLTIFMASFLILLQPDLGSAVELALVGFIVLYAYGSRLKHLFLTVASSLPILFYVVVKSPYRLARIFAFMDPWKDPQGTGFQLIQSFIALGSGGLFGVGLGNSKQKLFYLPESHTDFIFSIIGEEFGFVGTAFIVIVFLLLVWKCFAVAFGRQSEFARLTAIGISSMIGIEAIINIGVSSGIMPTKGLPLPFMSYGGSSMIAHLILIAIILNISKESVI
ncbi:MAG: putative lipid II flippase FtsW [Candidatus Omnitrophica bacterium]|nr:putative lipid II flippase FtsW [Candidatus Omnitrophota bacterium]